MRERVSIKGNRFIIPVHPSLVNALLALPGANKRRNGDISMPLNLISYHLLREIDFFTWDSSVSLWYKNELEIMDLGRAVNLRELETWDQPDLWEWQSQAIARLRIGSVALFDDRGMGKTRVVIEAIRESQSDGIKSAIIVTSRRLRHVWVDACGLWWDSGAVMAPLAATWSEAVDQIGAAPITVITYESLMNEDIHSAITELDPHWLVLEEAHNLKKRHRHNIKKEQNDDGDEIIIKTDTKSGLVRSLPGKVRVAVSGSPMPNVWYEGWTLLNFVAPDVFTSFWQFVEGIGSVTVNFWGGKEIDIEIHKPEIWEEIFDRWIILRDRSGDRRTIWDFVPIVLSKREKKAYRQMQEDMRAEKDGEVLDASNALAQATRLQQLAGGLGTWETYKDEEGRTKSSYQHADPSAKVDELIFRLNGLNRAVVFTRFRNRAEYVAERIESELGVEVLLMVGGISEKNQKKMLDRFMSIELYDDIVAVCVYGTISEGVNELVTSRDIFILDWLTAKDVAQAVDRLDRPGTRHDSIRAHILYSEETIDELAIDRSAFRVLPINKILRTPDAYEYLLNLVDRNNEAE